jgi:signal transduction histidine kinase
VSVIVGVSLAGATFLGMLHSHHRASDIEQSLGPYTDALAHHALSNPDPETWRLMAMNHHVTIVGEPADGEPVAFNVLGESLPLDDPSLGEGQIRSVRTAEDGTRVTFYWMTVTSRQSYLPLLFGLLIVLTVVVGSAFWFLQRQLKPLSWLHTGVDAVGRGDFTHRVPVVRGDEIGQIADAFNVMAGRVGEMISDRERLLADVSHELRSPIARMKVALEFMPEGDKRDTLAQDLREMENLIAVLLEREELRSRTGRLEVEAVDLTALTREVAATFDAAAVDIEVASDRAVTAYADPALMKLLIQNLLDNAVKFSRPDSRPVVATLEAHDEQVILRVVDDGIGIPEGREEEIFEPFVKLDRSRGHRVGYGVGLNLCQRIVQLHGGTIEVRRREPRGTEVIVSWRGDGPGRVSCA